MLHFPRIPLSDGPTSGSPPATAKEEAKQWLGRLSDKQSVSVADVLQILSRLMAQSEELPAMVPYASPSTLGPPREVDSLAILEQKLSQAMAQDDPQVLKESISRCLEIVRSEKINANRPVSPRTPATASTLDSATGLPGRLMFERIVTDSIAGGKSTLVVLFVVERLPLINKRFGRAVGDRALLDFAQHLAQEIPDSNSLSRWDGPAFCAIINAENSDKLEAEIRAVSNKPLSVNIEVGDRSVMLTITCACMMERADVNSSPEQVFAKIDSFVAARAGF